MPTEDEIKHMLPLQQVTLARAALAGITYERVTDEQRVFVSGKPGERGQWIMQTRIKARWPEGAYVSDERNMIREFEDELAAAIYCLDWLDNPCIMGMTCQCYRCKGKRVENELITRGFRLKPENEQ